jgi:YidC/Oxa1 family membrane protein insertase
MALWMYWLNFFAGFLEFLSSQAGLGEGLAIVALTLLVRTAILPISWSSAYRSCVRQKRIARLQPELLRLKEKLGDQPKIYAEQLVALYRKNGMTLTDGWTLLGALAQLPVLLGLYQALRKAVRGTRFLWIKDLSRPDTCLALLAGLTTMLLMSVNPDLPEHMRLVLIIVPSIVAVVVALKVASALTLYWTTSNCYSAVQTAVLHHVVATRIRSGSLKV